MIHYETRETISHVLTPEGAQIALHGSHEARVWGVLPTKGAGTPLLPADLKKLVGDESAKVGQGRAFKNGWIAKHGDGLVKAVCQQQSPPRHAAPLIFRSPDSQGLIDRGCDPERTS
jgi:phenylalanyl-tRNA synthetase alpha chain